MIVVDASAAFELARRSEEGLGIAQRFAEVGEPLHVPHLLDVEVVHALRRHVAAGELSPDGGHRAVRTLRRLPFIRYGHAPLLDRIWELRANVTAYDAVYVALAERLGATLLTRDARLARAPGVSARIEVF